jgi:hypothetical protein
VAKFNYKSSLSLFQTIFLISLTTVGTVVIMPRIVESQTPKETGSSVLSVLNLLNNQLETLAELR